MSNTTRRTFLAAAGAFAAATALPLMRSAEANDANSADPNRKLGFAFVGLGRFGAGQLMPAVKYCKNVRIAALVSGHPEKAKKLAQQYNVDEKAIYNYDNFDSIKDNPDIDVVYVVLPNSMHAEYTIRAANAKKHVMCEKPMAISVDECEKMIDACKKNDRKLQIGYRLQYEPHHMKCIEICRDKTYGPLRNVSADHSFNIGPHEWRSDKKLAGGGPLMDLGIYCLQASRYLTGEEPTHVSAQTWTPKDDPRFKDVHAAMAFTLKFPSGVLSTSTCSYICHWQSRLHFTTEQALLVMEQAFAYNGITPTFYVHGQKQPAWDIQAPNQFATEMDAFAQCVFNNTEPRTPGEEGLKDIKVMMKLYDSVDSGKTVEV